MGRDVGYALGALFAAGAVAAGLALLTARRGLVTSGRDGYEVPEHVGEDPDKRRAANRLVERWSGLVLGMCVVAAVGLVFLAASGRDHVLGVPALAVTAGWGTLAVMGVLYPFEKIKRL